MVYISLNNLKRIITLKKVVVIVVLLILAIVIINNFPEIKTEQNVLADTNIPEDYLAAISKNSEQKKGKSYSEFSIEATVKNFDKRVYVLDQYFLENNSPLYGNAKYFVNACNKNNAPKDCTTVVAIAMNETHLCKYSNSAEMHNCWGFGGPGVYRTHFNSFEDGINKVTDVLANQYGYKYMIDPSLMELTFCGREDDCVGWGNRIKFFMNQINDYSKSIGMGDLFSLR